MNDHQPKADPAVREGRVLPSLDLREVELLLVRVESFAVAVLNNSRTGDALRSWARDVQRDIFTLRKEALDGRRRAPEPEAFLPEAMIQPLADHLAEKIVKSESGGAGSRSPLPHDSEHLAASCYRIAMNIRLHLTAADRRDLNDAAERLTEFAALPLSPRGQD